MFTPLRRRAVRMPALAALALTLGLAVSGCAVVVHSQNATQSHPDQPVHLVTTFSYCIGPPPGFSGRASDASKTVTLLVYAGRVATSTPVETQQVPIVGGGWSTKPLAGLAPGPYVAVVQQADAAGTVASSQPVGFEVLGPCQSRRVVDLHL